MARPKKEKIVIDEDALYLAQDMMFQAYAAKTKATRLQKAKKALEISPYCADALSMLGNFCDNPDEAIGYYQRALEAGYQAIGAKDFKEFTGDFWGFLETRPYMRAKFSLAEALKNKGDIDGAIRQYEEMLVLNPNDNQGVRDLLLTCYFTVRSFDKAEALRKKYHGDGSPTWTYGRLFLAYQVGETQETLQKYLKAAKKSNSHAMKYILGQKTAVAADAPPYYSPGDESEAIFYALYHIKPLCDDTAFTTWLAENMKPAKTITTRKKETT